MTFTPFAGPAPLQRQATTGVGGFALQNATPTILSWTAPNDGQLHRVTMFGTLNVSSAETGGNVYLEFTSPSGVTSFPPLFPAGLGVGEQTMNVRSVVCNPGTSVSIRQGALTAGAATLWAEIWGS